MVGKVDWKIVVQHRMQILTRLLQRSSRHVKKHKQRVFSELLFTLEQNQIGVVVLVMTTPIFVIRVIGLTGECTVWPARFTDALLAITSSEVTQDADRRSSISTGDHQFVRQVDLTNGTRSGSSRYSAMTSSVTSRNVNSATFPL